MSLEQFGKNLKHLRDKNGMTQEQFGEKVFASQSMIAKIETGRYTPSLALVARICNALGQDITSMMNNNLNS